LFRRPVPCLAAEVASKSGASQVWLMEGSLGNGCLEYGLSRRLPRGDFGLQCCILQRNVGVRSERANRSETAFSVHIGLECKLQRATSPGISHHIELLIVLVDRQDFSRYMESYGQMDIVKLLPQRGDDFQVPSIYAFGFADVTLRLTTFSASVDYSSTGVSVTLRDCRFVDFRFSSGQSSSI
jgi:hypothetical protein